MIGRGDVNRKASIVTWGAGIFLGAASLFLVVDLMAGPVFSFSTRTWPPEVRGDKVIAGIEGTVKATDRDTGILRVASGFLGLSSLPVVVTPETEVAVNGKLGGVADLDRGQIVRVAYEVLPDRLLARRVDVLDPVASTNGSLPQESDRMTPTVSAASAAPNETTSEAASAEAAPPVPALPVEPSHSVAAPVAASVSTPVSAPSPSLRRSSSAATLPPRRPAVAVHSAPSPSSVFPSSTSAAPLASPPAAATTMPALSAPAARQIDDGTDAVDWLLKGTSGN